MKNKILLIITLLLIIPSITAYMPETHDYINIEGFEKVPNSPGGVIVGNHMDDFLACNLLSDISVFYYFSEGFSSIGQVYKDTHDVELCRRMMQLAGSDEVKLACAYGTCAHHVQDSVAHNNLVPDMILNTGMPNGFIHVFTEEDVNDNIVKRNAMLRNNVKNALNSRAPVHKDMFRQALVNSEATQAINFDSMYDKFVDTVAGSSTYSPGFKGFTAIPGDMHVTLLLLFTLSITSVVLLLKRSNNLFGKMLIGIGIIIAVFIISLYIMFLTNTLWMAFQAVSTPVTAVLNIPNMESYIIKSVDNTANLLNYGLNFALTVQDPAGESQLTLATEAGRSTRLIIEMLIGILVALTVYLALKKE